MTSLDGFVALRPDRFGGQVGRHDECQSESFLRGDAQMTSALGGGEGVSQFLTKGREVAWFNKSCIQ